MRKLVGGFFTLTVLVALAWVVLWAQAPPLTGQLVYAADRQGESGIFLTSVNALQPRFMVVGTDPSLCPAGQRIVYARGGDILCVPVGGGAPHQIIRHGLGVTVATPSPMPDGSGVVYTLSPVVPNSVPTIYTVGNDGSRQRRVVENGRDPVMSPDGRWIAFARGGDIYRIRPDGSQLSALTRHGLGVIASTPAYSPDGRRLAYTLAPVVPAPVPSVQIMNADGSGEMRLVADAAQPDFSPEGTWIVFVRGSGLFAATTDGANLRPLLRTVAGVTHPNWGVLSE